jgi:hypothetical protein
VQSSFSTEPMMQRLKISKCSPSKMNGLNCVKDSKTWPQSQMFSWLFHPLSIWTAG